MEKDKEKTSKDMVKELYADNIDAVHRYVFSLCRDNDDANDIVQETYLTALRKASQFVPGTKFLNWVFSIARFKFLEHNRKSARTRLFLTEDTLNALAEEAEKYPYCFDQELSKQKVQALQKCKKILSPRNHEYLRLRYDEGLKPARIAEKFGMKPESIHHALSKIRAFLRVCVDATLQKETDFHPSTK